MWRSNQLSYRTGRKNPRGGESNRAHTSCTEDGTGRPGFIFLYNFITSCEKYRSESLEGESYLLCQSPPLSKPFGTKTHGVSFQKGGVPAAPSGTATLLRLAPITGFTLGRPLRSRLSGTPGFHGLTGGVYKARERIHRAMADAPITSESSFMESGCRLQSELREVFKISILSPGSDLLYPPL